jgi:hypothetical protein
MNVSVESFERRLCTDGPKIVFRIVTHTTSKCWVVAKRYSQIRKFRRQVLKDVAVEAIAFPGKLLGRMNLNSRSMEHRRVQLNSFFVELVSSQRLQERTRMLLDDFLTRAGEVHTPVRLAHGLCDLNHCHANSQMPVNHR